MIRHQLFATMAVAVFIQGEKTFRQTLWSRFLLGRGGSREVQGFDKVVPPFEAFLKFHGGEGFEEVVPLSKTHRNSACLKG